jgi:fatty-acyl-CoA synthase
MNQAASGATSVVRGAPLSAEPGIIALTIPEYLREITARFGPREALVLDSGDAVIRWSYATLSENATALARALLAAGLGKDGRVGVLMSNRPELVSAAFGIAMAGGVTVLLSTFSTVPELQHLLKTSAISMLLYEARVAKKDFDEVLLDVEPAIGDAGPLMTARFPFLRRIVRLDPDAETAAPAGAIETWREFLRRGSAVPPALVETAAAAVKPSDAALVFFSSGTTGLPKGIVHSQRAATIQWSRWPRILSVSGDVRCWTANGFFWSGQFSMTLGCALSCGGAVVLQRIFDAEEALALMQAERVTVPLAWPHQWAKLESAENWATVDLHSLRYVDPRSPLARHATVTTTGWYEPPAYGATETFTIVAAFPDFTPDRQREHIQGAVLPGNTLKIVDPLSGEVLGRGERGEIVVKGPTLMLGYIGVPLSETLDDEGFFHTGDSGYIDDAERLYWEGRLSDIIKTGGANVSPREIDSLLSTYPGIKLSRTVGIPHDTLGEMVVACLVLHEGAALDESVVRDFLRARLASYKIPRRLLFFRQEEVPMTGSDKVKADTLVQRAVARLAFEASGEGR